MRPSSRALPTSTQGPNFLPSRFEGQSGVRRCFGVGGHGNVPARELIEPTTGVLALTGLATGKPDLALGAAAACWLSGSITNTLLPEQNSANERDAPTKSEVGMVGASAAP